jgi:hypothetical protein
MSSRKFDTEIPSPSLKMTQRETSFLKECFILRTHASREGDWQLKGREKLS